MRALPISIGAIHFVGIGGIGMSGIAEVIHTLGYQVQGSDISEGANVARLRAAGIPVMIGHDAANLGNAQVIVVSTAVKRDNPEVAAARQRRNAAPPARGGRVAAIGGSQSRPASSSRENPPLDALHGCPRCR
jgi:UDP-N-acetylmuramate-alanine ligase